MIRIRPADQRGHFDHGWLDTYHTFSFADYFDPQHMGFSVLRVLNDDRVGPGEGFDTHPHRDMEIVTYVLEGALEHRDSMGNGSVIRPDDVQRMSAGTGVTHSEFNASGQEPVHLLQIWILPERKGLPPGYEQTTFRPDEKRGRLRLVASREGRDGSVTLHQDADLYASILAPGQAVACPLGEGRRAWVQVARGEAAVNGQALREGDGAAAEGERLLTLTGGREEAELLLFDLP